MRQYNQGKARRRRLLLLRVLVSAQFGVERSFIDLFTDSINRTILASLFFVQDASRRLRHPIP